MNKTDLIIALDKINAKRVNRLSVAKLVLNNKELFPYLLELTFDFDNKISIKASWVLEFVCNEKLEWLFPYLDDFTQNMAKVTFESAIRPVSKISGFLASVYTSKNKSTIKKYLTKEHINIIIETGFDWLIGNQKIAVKVYSMEMLYLFGKDYDWVHQELKLIIEQNITKESSGYQARGKKILRWINKE